MTLDEHMESAKDIKEVARLLRRIQDRAVSFPKSHRLSKTLFKITSKDILTIKSVLDQDYHLGITKAQFKKLGHIYYGDDNV